MEVRESRRAHRRLGFFSSFFLVAALVSIAAVDTSVHDYFNEAFTSRSNTFFFHGGSEGLRAPCSVIPPSSSSTTSSPNITTGPKGKSVIRFDDVTFIRTKESADAQNEMQENSDSVEAIILDIKDRKRIGGAYLKSDMICCTLQLSEEKACKLSQVIIQRNPDNPRWPRRITTSFAGRNQEAKMESVTVEIDKTGMYYLYFMFCDPHLKGAIIREDSMEKSKWLFAVKKTLSRLLLLVVSMGYGVVSPNLGGITSRVLLFGGAYLVASESYELVEHLGNISDFSGKTALFLVLPVTLLDACFI